MGTKAKSRWAPTETEPTGNEIFAANLRRLMALRRITTRDLGGAIGASHQSVSRWMTEKNGPSRRRLAHVAEFLGVTVDTLLSAPDAHREADVGGKSVERVSVCEIEPKLTASGLEIEVRGPGVSTPTKFEWNIPASALADDASDSSETFVFKFAGQGLEPDVHPGDYIFANGACRTVSTPGLYLLAVASLPAWRRCEPLIGENVLVYHEACTQEVPAKDLAVRARAIAVHHKLPRG